MRKIALGWLSVLVLFFVASLGFALLKEISAASPSTRADTVTPTPAIDLTAGSTNSFKISPITYKVSFANTKPAQFDVTLTNSIRNDLKFSLGAAAVDKTKLKGYKTTAMLVVEGKTYDLLGDDVAIAVPANTTLSGKLTITPSSETPDFNDKFKVELTQIVDDTTKTILSSKTYTLDLDLSSTLGYNKTVQQQDLMGLAAIAGVSVVVILVGILINIIVRKKQNNGSQNPN